jgi:PAS domain S-box-containing protein
LSEGSAGPGPGAAPGLDAAAWLAAIVESSDDAMIGKTLDGVITSWNSAAEQLYGYSAGEILGQNVSVLIPPDRPGELRPILERVADGGHVERYETQRIRKDGTIFDVSITISPIRGTTGTIVGASTVARDISDRNRAQRELLALQDRLHQAQRLESLGQLAGGIAHDFNNLLAGIMNYAALASDGLGQLKTRLGLGEDDDAKTVGQDLAEITVVATRAAQLTRQLLIFGRREVVRAEVIDLNAIVTDMAKLLGQAVGQAIELVIDLAPDLPRTKVDRGQIEQVLMNLVVNGRNAMPGGGQLRIETAGCEAEGDWARQEGARPHHCVCLMVSDTGHGMAPDVRARAFDPFFTTKAKGEGSGLGLATVYGIVTQAGCRASTGGAARQTDDVAWRDHPAGRRRGHRARTNRADPGPQWLHGSFGLERRRGAPTRSGAHRGDRPSVDRCGHARSLGQGPSCRAEPAQAEDKGAVHERLQPGSGHPRGFGRWRAEPGRKAVYRRRPAERGPQGPRNRMRAKRK